MEYDRTANRQNIDRRISEIRKMRRLTTLQLAELTGLQQSNISRIEFGRYSTDIDLLGQIVLA